MVTLQKRIALIVPPALPRLNTSSGGTTVTKKIDAWSDELATGILWQDFQHAELTEHINRLQQAIIEKQAQAELWRMIDFQEKYIEDHFGMEERYMEAAHDPALRNHARAHQKFRENLNELREFDGTGAQLTAAALCYDLYE
jgi:hemerythrin-like metal-binding protein